MGQHSHLFTGNGNGLSEIRGDGNLERDLKRTKQEETSKGDKGERNIERRRTRERKGEEGIY